MSGPDQHVTDAGEPDLEVRDRVMTTDDTEGLDSAINNSDHTTPSPASLKRAATTPLLASAPSSTAASSRPSREGSPIRPPTKASVPSAARPANRSRKNSQADLSPHRAPGPSISTVPSAAAIQRALSAAGTPHLPPPTSHDSNTNAVGPSKVSRPGPGSATRTGPSSSRLNSPPPSASSGSNKTTTITARKLDHSQSAPTTPSIIIERPSRGSSNSAGHDSDVTEEEGAGKVEMRTPVRGMSGPGPSLETVQESSLPTTPSLDVIKPSQHRSGPNERPKASDENDATISSARDSKETKESKIKNDSGNESTTTKGADVRSGGEGKEPKRIATAPHSSKPPTMQSKKSFTQLPTKGKVAGEGSVKNMTVETETVSSIPQVALGGGAIERNIAKRTETGGSVRLKPSNETIRPKKEKKKVVRKAPSVNAGTASSKADVFEAKVATAVGEADSSDSEETFVYESNPPEPLSARPYRFHSRTPSAASTVSQLDYHKNRQDGHHSVVGKKSMKFANNYGSIGYSNDGEGTVRGTSQGGRGLPHHHIGRYGRGGHTSLFDNESPFPDAKRSGIYQSRNSTPRQSPRTGDFFKVAHATRKAEDDLAYDLEGEGADDERTSLLTGSIRTGRNRRRVQPGSVRQMYSADDRRRHCCSRVTAFTALGSILVILIAAMVIVFVMCSKPLIDVHIEDIRNVLASEQEIMLDLHVRAINPNLISVQVNDLDVNIFAKSKHVGTTSQWLSNNLQRPEMPISPLSDTSPGKIEARSELPPILDTPEDIVPYLDGGVDRGTDPIDDTDPASDLQTMLLGQIFSFDSPLNFDPSPLRRQSLVSDGEVRLAHPGNQTEEGGSARWEHVLLHDFELIVRGVLRYSSPISSKTRRVSIAGRVLVHPSDENDGKEANLLNSLPVARGARTATGKSSLSG